MSIQFLESMGNLPGGVMLIDYDNPDPVKIIWPEGSFQNVGSLVSHPRFSILSLLRDDTVDKAEQTLKKKPSSDVKAK